MRLLVGFSGPGQVQGPDALPIGDNGLGRQTAFSDKFFKELQNDQPHFHIVPWGPGFC